jgi:CelD/BcsL family acetyltransferase involved in cellulose biosynthesis
MIGRVSLALEDRVEALAPEWDDLAERTNSVPFLRPGWIRAWRSAFGSGELVIVSARRKGRLIGVLPLERRRGALRSPTNPHSPQFGLLVEDEEATHALARALFAREPRAVVLAHLDRGTEALDTIRREAKRAGYRDVVRTVARSPYIVCRHSLVDHERSLSHNLRHDVQRRSRRLCEAGSVWIQVSDGGDRLDELLAEGFGVEQLSWNGARGTAIASEPQALRFYTDVARWAAPLDWLRLAFLRLEGRAIAFQFDLEVGGAYYSLKIGYDPAYDRFSPGKLLAYAMVARAVTRGLASYELLGTNEPWKYRWTKTTRERVALHAFASSPAGTLSWAAFAHGRSLGRRLPLASRVASALRR